MVYLQVLAWLCSLYVAIFTVAVPFVYRYLLVCRQVFFNQTVWVTFRLSVTFALTKSEWNLETSS